MNIACRHCGALHWEAERLQHSPRSRPEFGICCNSGKVQIPSLPDPPPALRDLFTGTHRQAVEFRNNIRQYNSTFAFTSLRTEIDEEINNTGGRTPWVFRINGDLYHRGGTLVARAGERPRYAQLYVYDPRMALEARAHRNSNLRQDTLRLLQDILNKHHQYAPLYRFAYEWLQNHGQAGDASEDVTIRLTVDPSRDRRRYNLPTADDVAVILPGQEPTGDYRDILLRTRAGPLQRIHEGHPGYAPLHYPLLFPHGTSGWYRELRQRDPDNPAIELRESLSQTRYYAYRLQYRPEVEFSTILHGGRLFQEYIVDAWAASEQERLRFLSQNQGQLRASLYSGLEDALRGGQDVDLADLGQIVVLPSSYTGSPRHMQQLFQDSMAIARYFKKVDLFLTMTANPNWEEVTRELLPGQSASDRPDLVARVFQMKKKALLQEILKDGIFGHAVAHVYTIEFQKRGLPHMHLLIFLDRQDKLLDPAAVDSAIRATWPDPKTEPELFEAVKSCMVHGPCGELDRTAVCMENGRCRKNFPKPFQDGTSLEHEGYPLYHRPDDGRAYEVRGHFLDNRWIVPYNPYLLARYQCHINVECSVTFASLKYINKYIHKGHDRGTLQVSIRDEIKDFIDSRYVTAPEGVWRLLHFELHGQSPTVVRLQVHLPGQHLVVFDPQEDPERVRARAANERTMLTAFFEANRDGSGVSDIARRYTYQEFPQHFVWKEREKKWAVRQRGFALGRMYFISPNAGPRYYLRMLLTVVRGPTSFEALRIVNGHIYCTDQSLAARHASHGPPPSLILAAVTRHHGVRRL